MLLIAILPIRYVNIIWAPVYSSCSRVINENLGTIEAPIGRSKADRKNGG